MTNFKVNLNEYIEGELDTVHDISFWMGNEIWWSGGETAGVSRALLTASFVWKVVLKFSSVEMWTEGKTCSFYSTIVLRPNKSFIRNRSGGTSMEINGNLTCTCGCALIDNTIQEYIFENVFLFLTTEERRDW